MTAQPAETTVQRVNPRWGEPYGETVAYVTEVGSVWMHRRGQKVRFFDLAGQQVGPEHANVYPAQIWAAFHGWIDPASPNLSIACITEVRRQVAERAAMDPKTQRELDKVRPDLKAAVSS